MTKEHYDDEGNLLEVGDLTFVKGILGKGSYGTVRLARRNRNGAVGSSDESPMGIAMAERIETPQSASNVELTPVPRNRRSRVRGSLTKSRSAPVGDSFFKMTDEEQCSLDLKSPLQKAAATINQVLKTSSSLLGSEPTSEKEDEDLVAVKIFSKSLLKRKRHMERNRETRRVQVKTALDQVEREIALMKKLSHPNLVDFIEALDSPESDMLYMVRY